MTPAAALALLTVRVPQLGGAAVVRRLSESIVSDKFLLDTGDGDMVLVIDRPMAAAVGLDREREQRVLARAAAAGIAPVPVAADSRRGLLVVRYHGGVTVTDDELRTDATLVAVGQLLRRVHELTPVVDANGDLERAIERYGRLAGVAAGPRVVAAKTLIRAAAADGSHADAVLTHGDPGPGNFIRTREALALIDWEYAGMRPRWFDLAMALQAIAVTGRGASALLAGYGDPDGRAEQRLAAWQPVAAAVTVLWQMALAIR